MEVAKKNDLLGSGPVEDYDLCNHHTGEFPPFLGGGPIGDNDSYNHHTEEYPPSLFG